MKVIAEKVIHLGMLVMRCPWCKHASYENDVFISKHECHRCRKTYEVEIPWFKPPKPRKGRLIGGVPIQ